MSPDVRALTGGCAVMPTTNRRLTPSLTEASAMQGANYMVIGRVRTSNGRMGYVLNPSVESGTVTAL